METFARDQQSSGELIRAALQEAAARLNTAAPEWRMVQEKMTQSHTSWLLPSWRERPDTVVPAPPAAPCYYALATDGSQIVADRHDLALCYLINIGFISLRYGPESSATLRSRPTLATPDATLLSEFHGDQEPIATKRFAMRCRLHEIMGLAELIEQEVAGAAEHMSPADQTAALPMIALCDGSLILWPLESERDEAYRKETLGVFVEQLEIARHHGVPLAGYISKPMSKDVVNALRVSVCPYERADCDQHCPGSSKAGPQYVAPPCAGTERITDAVLFADLLAPGERSAVFGSGSKILAQYAPAHRIAFFYLHTGREIARIEIPQWVAEDARLLEQTHALCYDQSRKGDGYPVALGEAHEQAIVRGAERAAFFHLMERHFVRGSLPLAGTQKALSKRARRV